ncbi:hypothetical protein KSP39_PZI006985 [Platanthera zijinensis]|uniref:SUN domain-containing protein n=1 Tax=Platanthera zijinensis TaxID=2320716 RepID=A0AAP0GA35_9ASPA
MKRSRKALLQRRAASSPFEISMNKHLYFKASLFFLLWGVIFFLSSLINHGDSFEDLLGDVVDESNMDVATAESSLDSMSCDTFEVLEPAPKKDILETNLSGFQSIRNTEEDYVQDESISNLPSSSGKEFSSEETPILIVQTDYSTISQKNDRISRVTPPGFDEFKNKAFTAKERSISSESCIAVHRVDPSGAEYNYASSSKGAKVLAFNKEAKGAFNILDKDKDKYLRNPCSAGEKYVVIELSEETLVDSLGVANFEHYSSNFKDFELFSSLVYPTDSWIKLGNFTAQNVKHTQRFVLPEPKWTRYLKFNLLSHYGSEFYCTLSVVEVYGVDAVERMLEDLIAVENKRLVPEEQTLEKIPSQELSDGDDVYQELLAEIDYESMRESPKKKLESTNTNIIDPVENKPLQVGRMPGDTVLKILMQKVQSFDVNFSILERYLEELNSRYGHIFKELDDDLATKDSLLEKTRLDVDALQKNRDMLENKIGDFLLWKYAVSLQLDQLVKESADLRSEIKMSRDHQADTENKRVAVLFVSFILGFMAAGKLFINIVIFICRIHDSEYFCRTSSAWLVMLFSSSIIIFIMVI